MNLAELKQRHNLTWKHIARAMQVSVMQVWKYNTGRNAIPDRRRERLEAYINALQG